MNTREVRIPDTEETQCSDDTAGNNAYLPDGQDFDDYDVTRSEENPTNCHLRRSHSPDVFNTGTSMANNPNTADVPSNPSKGQDVDCNQNIPKRRRSTTNEDEEDLAHLEHLKTTYGLSSDQDLKDFEQEYLCFIQNNLNNTDEVDKSDLVFESSDILLPNEDIGILVLNHEKKIFDEGCGCTESCQTKFPRETIMSSRLEALEMNNKCELGVNHLNLYVAGAINSFCKQGPATSQKGHLPKFRKITHTSFHFQGISVCKQFFWFVNAITERKYKNIKKNVLAGNLSCTGTNSSRTNLNEYEKNVDAVTFIKSFSEQNALVLPGRVPSFHNPDLHLLPSSMNKRYVYDKYHEAAVMAAKDPVSLKQWYYLWQNLTPNIVIQKPKTDLCSKCESNITSISKMHALDEHEKQSLIEKSANHLHLVQSERSYYKRIIDEAAKTFANRKLGKNEPCSSPGTMHYSFDYAQQVHIPHSSQQIGPLYFLTGYKVSLFGIAAEPLKQFVLYIIPEACITGKGANSVISFLDHFFENFAVGETDVICHADNCCGQNKNNCVMQYGLWRTLTGKHKTFQLSFLPVGHTKFAPDLYFGLFKKRFRLSETNTIKDVCETAVTACHNSDTITAVVVGNETGETINVHSYDWTNFFKQRSPLTIPQLLSYNHFKAKADSPGIICCGKTFDNEVTTNVTVFKPNHGFTESDSPTVIPPMLLSFERQQYLYHKIREYVHPDARDVLCPEPMRVVTPNTEDPLQVSAMERDNSTTNTVPETTSDRSDCLKVKRKSPKCSYCGVSGHRNQIRNNVFFCKKREADERPQIETVE